MEITFLFIKYDEALVCAARRFFQHLESDLPPKVKASNAANRMRRSFSQNGIESHYLGFVLCLNLLGSSQ
jgi:hypothetical protein